MWILRVFFYSSCGSSLGRGPVAEVFAGVDPADVYFILPVTPLWEEDWSQRRPADVVSQTFTFLGLSSNVSPVYLLLRSFRPSRGIATQKRRGSVIDILGYHMKFFIIFIFLGVSIGCFLLRSLSRCSGVSRKVHR